MTTRKTPPARRKEVRHLSLPTIEARTGQTSKRLYQAAFDLAKQVKDAMRHVRRIAGPDSPMPSRWVSFRVSGLNSVITHVGTVEPDHAVWVSRRVGTVTSCHDVALAVLTDMEVQAVKLVALEKTDD